MGTPQRVQIRLLHVLLKKPKIFFEKMEKTPEKEAQDSDEGSSSGGENDPAEDGDDEREGSKSPDSNDNDGDEQSKSGWADAMAKVLNIGKGSTDLNKGDVGSILLSKARKDAEVKNKKKTEGENTESVADIKNVKKEGGLSRTQKKYLENMCRSKPDITKDKLREKILSKLATRGVVQLFNAVREQQKSLKSQLNSAGGSIRKREAVFKNIDKKGFLDQVLGGRPASNESLPSLKVKKEIKMEVDQDEDEASNWTILKDDYMMGAKMKDWDRCSDSE